MATGDAGDAPVAADTLEALLDRARTRLSLHDRAATQQAIALLHSAEDRAPEDPRVKTLLAFALTTEATKFGGDEVIRAETLARQAVATAPEAAGGWHALGYALDAQGRIDEALAAYGEALRLDPEDFAARSSAAYLLTIRGRLYDALQLDADALAHGNLYVELQIARSLRLIGDDVRARAFEARALLLNPDHAVVLSGLAEAALARGELDRVDALIAQAQAADQGGALAWLAGRAALIRGDVPAARAAFERAGDAAVFERAALTGEPVDPGRPELSDTWPEHRVRAAELAAAQGETDRALALLSSAVDLGWRDAALLRRSPFLQAMAEAGALDPVLARIEREIAAQAVRLDRDSNLSARLDAVIASSD